jgi:ribosomal protein S18 acetylase RimI-like enzyme
MSCADPTFAIKTASEEQIRNHLESCDFLFEPPLHRQVEVSAYARKIVERGVTFEAWVEGTLAGLLAAYFNDQASRRGFVTIVSIVSNFQHFGIAGQLMRNAVSYGASEGFKTLVLDVNSTNAVAIALYVKHGFMITKTVNDKLTMELTL